MIDRGGDNASPVSVLFRFERTSARLRGGRGSRPPREHREERPAEQGVEASAPRSLRALLLAAMIAAWMLRNRLVPRVGGWNAALIAGAAYLIVVIGVALALPEVSEVPDEFPAVVLWQFRMASAGAQLVMWSTIGLGFGALAESAAASRSGFRLNTTAPGRRAPL